MIRENIRGIINKVKRQLKTVTSTLLGAIFMSTVTITSAAEMSRISENAELEAISNIVELTIEVNTSLEKAWSLLAVQFDKSETFNNNASSTLYLEKTENVIGSKRRTLSGTSKFIDVEITEFDEQEHYIAWEIYATNIAPLKVAFSSYKLVARENGSVIIKQRAGFKLRNVVMDFIGKLRFHKLFIDELATIKYVLETGESKTSISKNDRKNHYYPSVSVHKFY